jgi:hypothetical protein
MIISPTFCRSIRSIQQGWSVGAAREAFDELSIEDQLKAVRFAKPYATAIKAHNRNFPVNAAKWLSERRFDEIERILIAKAQAGGLKDQPGVRHLRNRAWSACAAEFRRTKGKDPPQVEHEGQTGWWFSSLSSPGCHPGAAAGARSRAFEQPT